MSPENHARVTFLPSGIEATCGPGDDLLTVSRRFGALVPSECGGTGSCRSCAVRILGAVPAATPEDEAGFSRAELNAGWRLACRTRVSGSCQVYVPGPAAALSPSPGQDDGPSVVPVEEPVLSLAPQSGCWRRGERLVGPSAGRRALGLAVDLGTTNIAAALVDMCSGEVIASGAAQNPQVPFGADVIGRLTLAVRDPAAARTLQAAAANGIAGLADRLTGGAPDSIVEAAVVGNPVMQHLLLGAALESLARAPYRPLLLDATDIRAADVGLRLAPGAWIHAGPNVGGFVGSDHVAALLELLTGSPLAPWVLIDIGTNTEISVCTGGLIRSTSCASGPAFEGGALCSGMRALPGAITAVSLRGGAVSLETISQAQPAGICGSGAVSLLSELLRNGIVDGRGRLCPGHPRVREANRQREFLVADRTAGQGSPIRFTQADIRAIQLAKAAIRTGLEFLLAETGTRESAIEQLFLAGAFGKYLDVDAALRIGLLPPIARHRIVQFGNAAGAGVRRILACGSARASARALALEARNVELAGKPGFSGAFARRLGL